VNSSGMLHAADFGISSVCLPRRMRASEIPRYGTGGALDLYMSNAPQGAPIGRIVWPAPAGFNPGLDPKPRHPAGPRLPDLRRWRHATLVGCSAPSS
jgi:hypothetical protein